MSLFLEGLLLGVVPVFFVGPVLFTLLGASLEQGFGAGARVALGIAASDVVAIAVCAAGLGPILTLPTGQQVLHIAGGIILIGFGAAMVHSAAAPPSSVKKGTGRHFLTGFVVNFVNPFVFTFWIGALGGVQARHGLGVDVLVPLFGGMVATILVTDLLKAALAGALMEKLGSAGLIWARRISGGLLAGAGIWLLVTALIAMSSGATA